MPRVEPKTSSIVLSSSKFNAYYPKLGLHFRNGRCSIPASRLEELKAAAGKLWNREFGILGEFKGSAEIQVQVTRGASTVTSERYSFEPPHPAGGGKPEQPAEPETAPVE
jgi:hypothetical protein